MIKMNKILAASLLVFALFGGSAWDFRGMAHQQSGPALVSSPPVERAPNGDIKSVYPPYFRPDR